jgi:hypothetical protein
VSVHDDYELNDGGHNYDLNDYGDVSCGRVALRAEQKMVDGHDDNFASYY